LGLLKHSPYKVYFTNSDEQKQYKCAALYKESFCISKIVDGGSTDKKYSYNNISKEKAHPSLTTPRYAFVQTQWRG